MAYCISTVMAQKKSHPGTLPFSSRGENGCCKNTNFFSTCKGFSEKVSILHIKIRNLLRIIALKFMEA